MKNEFEARFLNINPENLREKLIENGFTSKSARFLMRRQTFDFKHVEEGISKWARVRQEATQTTISIKEVRGKGIGDVFESEVSVDDFDNACELMKAAELIPASLQENYREEWVKKDYYVTIDTWPGLEPFVEIEAPTEEMVKIMSQTLGFEFDSAVYGSIDKVYEKEMGIDCKSFNSLEEVSFGNPPS